MLVKFGAKNFFSFKEGFEISFEHGKSLLHTIAIKGANASGKTNVIKVLSFLNAFVTNSFVALKPEDEIMIFPFFHNTDPISLYIIFKDNDIEYKYEIDLTHKAVLSETLYKKAKRWTKVIQRDKNKLTTCSLEFKELNTINLSRKNASLISIAKQYEIQCIQNIYDFFHNISTNVHVFGRHTNEEIFPDYKEVSALYAKDSRVLSFVIDILKRADTGIDTIDIIESLNQETNKKEYLPIFKYKIQKNHQVLTYQEQSNGVKSLYLQLGLYAIALDLGLVLALDEFDINLHPDILPMLIDLFEDKMINTKDAQIIFTTHNNEIMDKLGKYKVILVNKEENESYLYRLDEIGGDMLRADRPISPIYKANKIGGKPKVVYHEKI